MVETAAYTRAEGPAVLLVNLTLLALGLAAENPARRAGRAIAWKPAMAANRTAVQYDAPRIPMRHASWFIRLLMLLAVLILAGVVYGFWGISQAPSPKLELPDAAQPQTPPPQTPPPPSPQAP
jgi:hypothetical protein